MDKLYDKEKVDTLIRVMLRAAREAGGNLLEVRDAADAVRAACDQEMGRRIEREEKGDGN